MADQALKHEFSKASELNAAAYETSEALNEYVNRGDLFPIEKSLIGEFFKPQFPVLDIGCGAGRTTYRLRERGFEVVGADLSETLLKAAALRCPDVPFHHADVRSMPFEDGSFRQVLFSFNGMDQVHPLGDYLEALVEIRRVLRPGGILIYSGHNILGRFGRHMRSLRELASATLRAHPPFLRAQLRGADIRNWYWRYPEPFGEVISLSAPPSVHRRLHARAGLETIAVRGQNNEISENWITLREHHVHYVARKR